MNISILTVASILLSNVAPLVAQIPSKANDYSSSSIIENQSLGIATFTPPKGWKAAGKEALSAHVKILVIGPKIKNEMPPTMNLMIEPYTGTLKSYLSNVKKINESHGDSWKDLGSLKTKAGDASLSQVEIRSKWGGEKLMHAIIVRDGFAYVLTATASKGEFGRFYQQFYTALRSFDIHNNILDLIKNPEKRAKLENSIESIKSVYQQNLVQYSTDSKEQVFDNPTFQHQIWLPFLESLRNDFSDLGIEWQSAVSDNLKESLLEN